MMRVHEDVSDGKRIVNEEVYDKNILENELLGHRVYKRY